MPRWQSHRPAGHFASLVKAPRPEIIIRNLLVGITAHNGTAGANFQECAMTDLANNH